MQINTDELFWGQFYSMIHELAEQIRAKKTVTDPRRQAEESVTATYQVTEVTQPNESTLLGREVQTGGE